METVTLGGKRLGSGKRMEVKLKAYERSTHDLSYLWRSTMAAGTLVPFLSEVGLPGDTFDIDLNCDIKTHPTVGPLFGSYKVQMDVFSIPVRLYNGKLHNNALNIGMNMEQIKLPQLELSAPRNDNARDNSQVNPSSLLAYLGIRGVGKYDTVIDAPGWMTRWFNAIPFLGYFDIFKNYYANKQESEAYIIHTDPKIIIKSIVTNGVTLQTNTSTFTILATAPDEGYLTPWATSTWGMRLTYSGGTPPEPAQIVVKIRTNNSLEWQELPLTQVFRTFTNDIPNSRIVCGGPMYEGISTSLLNWRYATAAEMADNEPKLVAFDLENLDIMRQFITSTTAQIGQTYEINHDALRPYGYPLLRNDDSRTTSAINSQEGLLVKTYQSDLFNNWLNEEWIDYISGVAGVSNIDTSDGNFSISSLLVGKKVYDMLNRVAVSDGTYKSWVEVNYDIDMFTMAETPIYHGGLSKELVFQEVVSNSASYVNGTEQPLGQLAGRGVMAGKHKGGKVTIKLQEHSYIMGIISLTPRVDYSQGNKWDTNLKNMDDFHKPALDEIGFQELITDQMAYWDTNVTETNELIFKSAGYQPAWTNYTTAINRTFGNFAVEENEMFMTLNRRYEREGIYPNQGIKDLTTYIDPAKYNFIFAETPLDAQNFWAQISVDMIARRKMSAKIMPNL